MVLLIIFLGLMACGGKNMSLAEKENKADETHTEIKHKKRIIGFSQVGAESEWRKAITRSILEEFANNPNLEVQISDGHGIQENQVKDIRTFIARKVDLIVLAPVVETGWDLVLTEAKRAKIPVIIINRTLKLKSGNSLDDYIVTLIAPDNVESGKKAANFLVDRFKNTKDDVNIAVLEGTADSSPAVDRKAGFEEIIKKQSNFKIIKSQSGNFNKAEGRETMDTIFREVRAENKKIDALYCQNEDMALGAIDVIEATGFKPGSDIVIVSNGGLKSTFQAMTQGKINANVDNPPQYGPILIRTIIDYFENKPIDKWIKLDNGLYTQDVAAKELIDRKY